MITHRPLYDRVIVRVLTQGERTSGGLYRPQSALDNTPYLFAEVISVGHGRMLAGGDIVPLRVKPGDMVTFFRLASSGEQLIFPDPEDDSKELMIIREPHITTIATGASALVVVSA